MSDAFHLEAAFLGHHLEPIVRALPRKHRVRVID
jgi:hypothetical protein